MDYQHFKLSDQQLLELCLIGGHMQIFNKLGLEKSYKERTELLKKAVEQAKDKERYEDIPIIETNISFVAIAR